MYYGYNGDNLICGSDNRDTVIKLAKQLGYDNIEITTEEKPRVISLDELKAQKLTAVDAWTAAKITCGFTSDASGELVRYDSDKDTQLTMQGIALNVNTDRFAVEYPNGCPVRGVKDGDTEKSVQLLSAEQVLAWCADLSVHIGNCKQEGWTKQNLVNKATTKEELDLIEL